MENRKTSEAFVSKDPYSASCHHHPWGCFSLAIEELCIVHQHQLQLLNLQIDYAVLPSQELETLHPTQPNLPPPSGESLSPGMPVRKGDEVTVSSNVQTLMQNC